ncbi:MAG: haloacid dehalogenase-like hydrolase [Erysipelotrichaceae bacterium]|nr:haloacid dehalogenase-like hydrolase [Erysipelotrichaceae bacterium]
MKKRMLSCYASDFASMNKEELLYTLRSCEGRTMMSETICTASPLLEDVTNAELAASFGADFLLLNMFDVNKPIIKGLPECKPEDTIRLLKKLTGRPIGINLEPAAIDADNNTAWALTSGRQATKENALKAVEMGIDLILLTGNPGIGVDNDSIVKAIKELKETVGDKLIIAAGKMHGSGILKETSDAILTLENITDFIEAGADIILMPSPGTIPGVDIEWAKERINHVHKLGKLVITAIGTSQEGADRDTIRQIALMAKQAGSDIHHIGDSGVFGIAVPENIMTYSITIRGIRHTYHRMAASINR